ncbi:DUF4326 domain-containing protein [Mesorhizobium sp. CN2-181]|uniref:DUF4326 domain-containing protein n=1 Tax=Mesorhizobium yinganensis TaxID=3157707 RepID=UPI0032B78AF8
MGIVTRKPVERLFDQSFNPRDPAKPRVHNKHRRTAPQKAVYIGRGSPYGNNHQIGLDGTREEVIAKYKARQLPYLDLRPLIGQHLVCFCKPAPCHGDALLICANSTEYMALETPGDRYDWILENT